MIVTINKKITIHCNREDDLAFYNITTYYYAVVAGILFLFSK